MKGTANEAWELHLMDLRCFRGPGHRWEYIMGLINQGLSDKEIAREINRLTPRKFDYCSPEDMAVYRKVHDDALDWSASDNPENTNRREWTTLAELIRLEEL